MLINKALQIGDDFMSTNSITQPMKIKASQIKKLNTQNKISSSMIEVINKNKELYKTIGNHGIIKSLKI